MFNQVVVHRFVLSVVTVVASVVLTPACFSGEIASGRQAEIVNMVVQDCGSCHGMTLKGGLGPALTPDAIAEKHNDMLVGTILYGRSGTAMPPWKTFLTEDEARWLVDKLKQGEIKR